MKLNLKEKSKQKCFCRLNYGSAIGPASKLSTASLRKSPNYAIPYWTLHKPSCIFSSLTAYFKNPFDSDRINRSPKFDTPFVRQLFADGFKYSKNKNGSDECLNRFKNFRIKTIISWRTAEHDAPF